MNQQDKALLKELLTGMGGIRIDRMLEDCEELIDKFTTRRVDTLLDDLQDEIDDVVEVVEEGKGGRQRKKKVRKGMGKK